MKHHPNQGIQRKNTGRCVWTAKEDAALEEASRKYKGECWNLVAEYVQSVTSIGVSLKTPKQCRERWNNQLNPKVQLTPLTEEEVRKVFALHARFGNCWSKISSRIQGRTDNSIKNYFLCRLRRLTRCIRRGIVEQVVPRNEEDLLHTLYLLDYLYKYYLSPVRCENIMRSLNSQTRKRRNDGDRYINMIISNENVTADKLSSFIKELIRTSSFEVDKSKIKDYCYLLDLKANGGTVNTSSIYNALHSEDIKNESLHSTSGSLNLYY